MPVANSFDNENVYFKRFNKFVICNYNSLLYNHHIF